MIGRHRSGRSLRRRLVVAVLAAAVGRGYRGRHRLAEAALRAGEVPAAATPVAVPAAVPGAGGAASGHDSVAPSLRVAVAPAQPDQLADTVPHPVVTLFPLSSETTPAASTTPADAASVDDRVFAVVDAEREGAAVAGLVVGDDVDPYRPRHTA